MEQTRLKIEQEKIIVIIRGVYGDTLLKLTESLFRGGIRLMECTFDATATVPDEKVAENIRALVDHFKDEMTFGAGTVIRENQVALTAEVGGKFIVSPNVDEAIISATKRAGLVSIPGALTPTEIATAHKAGADFVKLFPANAMGPAYLKAICAPLSNVNILAVGGVNESTVAQYAAAGACGYGIGASTVADPSLIAAGDFAAIEKRAAAFVQTVKNLG